MLWTRHVHPRGSQDAGDSRVISGCPPTHSGSWRPLLFSSASPCLLQGPSHYSPWAGDGSAQFTGRQTAVALSSPVGVKAGDPVGPLEYERAEGSLSW